jgi:DNA-binding CsgD family transcriptional regulator
MLQILGYLLFIVSVALAAGGVVLSSRLRSRHRNDIFSTLLYFQVFIFTFGFYGIWGQVVIRSFLSAYISEEILVKISNIAMLLGLPFLVFAWLMLIQFAREISGRKNNNWFILWFLLINFSIIIIVGYLVARTNAIKPILLLKYYFILMHFIYSIASAMFILLPGKGRKIIHEYDSKRMGTGISAIALLQCLPLVFYDSQAYIAIIYTLMFFAGNTFLPVYLSYATLMAEMTSAPEDNLSFEEFCRKFEVSPRETDIVREICNGLSNKEISEKLFISLQTVKDHTHRIYIKTNVRSRVQLIYLVKELKTS